MDARTAFVRGPLVAAALLLAGCASVGVSPSTGQAPDAQGKRPTRLVIVPFDYDRCALNVDREGAELETFKRSLADALASDVALRTPRLGLEVAVVPKPPVEAEAAWLVRGGFTRVNQGSRAARTLIGFGLGGTKMEARVEVYDLSSDSLKPLFTFETSGGSGAGAGALLSTNPYSFAADVAIKSGAGVEDDRTRTSRMILAYVAEQLAARGWLSAEAAEKAGAAKRLDDDDSHRLQGDAAPDASFDHDTETATAARKPGARSK